ncbi:FAD-containing oxidoreductase [Streptococcus sp. CSL10205-OR2]|uniref:FAD-containing oxidoreductase n=1 Tax=Streptococcus sp. CSL10205-OR2 TaxID=2980558 RepID=UPI0021D9FC1B|nr:FAD-containing oxidoreductase [Streptococcus sp. CSL10205-OR2]MCU9534024.1 FAD-containing oxidoreductase [Streptococcus sp. CSL10205-OR2]
MKEYDLIVIGFGKGGKTLAAKMAAQGKSVAMIEQDAKMYGGTCINIGCIPTKTMLHSVETGHDFKDVMSEKEAVTSRLRQKNYDMLANAPTADVYTAKARFISDKVIEINSNGETRQLTGKVIVINTGSVSNVLPIPGLLESKNVFDSTQMQTLTVQPKTLGIIGGGNIGLEFANLYSQLGTKVTIFDPQNRIFSREEEIISQMAQEYMEEAGISFELSSTITKVKNNDNDKTVIVTDKGEFEFDVVMYATGRKPNTADLGLENTDIKVSERGAIVVDDYRQTTVTDVFAVGDVNGGPQFTYISLDDFRIVFDYLNGDKSYSIANRPNIPNTTFINPPLARVGLDEKTAKEKGLPYKVNSLLVAQMPRAHVNSDLRGLFKVVVHKETKEILGATIFGAEAHEIINLVTMAMDNHIPYTYFKKQIFTHPTMAENLNDLFNF